VVERDAVAAGCRRSKMDASEKRPCNPRDRCRSLDFRGSLLLDSGTGEVEYPDSSNRMFRSVRLSRSNTRQPPARLGTTSLATRFMAGWRVASVWGVGWVLGEVVVHALSWSGIVPIIWPFPRSYWGLAFIVYVVATAIIGFTVGLFFSLFVSLAEHNCAESRLSPARGAFYGMLAGGLSAACLTVVVAMQSSSVGPLWIGFGTVVIPRFALWGAIMGAVMVGVASARERRYRSHSEPEA
jgi:hypothetical protein